MSSYVVDPETINVIVSGLHAGSGKSRAFPDIHSDVEHEWGHQELFVNDTSDTAILGQALYDLNIEATSQRYPDDARDQLPGSYADAVLAKYTWKFKHVDLIMVYRAIGEYLYQCSEGDADENKLFVALKNYRNALARKFIDRHIDESDAKRAGW